MVVCSFYLSAEDCNLLIAGVIFVTLNINLSVAVNCLVS